MKKLLADKKLIKAIRQNKPADAYLYNLLCAGKITLQEYLMATK